MLKITWYRVWTVLTKYSDEDHQLTNKQIREYIDKDYNIVLGWKSVTSSIETLISLDIEIVKTRKGRSNYFYLNSRPFTIPQLLVLLSGVHANHSIPVELSKELTEQLLETRSVYERSDFKRFLYYTDYVKYSNTEYFRNVLLLNHAIRNKKRIRFVYLTWNIDKEMVRYNNDDYVTVTPLFPALDHEKDYLVAWKESVNEIRHYRIDKIIRMEILDEPATVNDRITDISNNQEKYIKENFSMFGGKETLVMLEGKADKVGILYDMFGTEIPAHKEGNDRFHARVKVGLSSQFFGWIDSMETDIVIVGPSSVLEAYQDHLDKLTGISQNYTAME